jgi:serine O-acetyltransferase
MQIKSLIIRIKQNLKRIFIIRMLFKFLFHVIDIIKKMISDPIKDIIMSLYCYGTIKVYLCNHMTIGIWKLYRKRTVFPHPIGIVIGMKVEIGFDCTIYQNVTIGTKDTEHFLTASYPQIGNNVTIFPNAIIIGNIIIGNNATIGAGSIVLNDVPENSVVVGNPARLIK